VPISESEDWISGCFKGRLQMQIGISEDTIYHHRFHAQALLFYAFDVIVCRGKSLVSTPLEKRRTLLNEIFEDLDVV